MRPGPAHASTSSARTGLKVAQNFSFKENVSFKANALDTRRSVDPKNRKPFAR
jgi:hypothetical protein